MITVRASGADMPNIQFSFDLVALRKQKHLIVPLSDTPHEATITLLGGFVSFSFPEALGLERASSRAFAKHCRIKLIRLKKGKPFLQKFRWEDPLVNTGEVVLTLSITYTS